MLVKNMSTLTRLVHFKATSLGLESSIDHWFAIYPYSSYCQISKLLLHIKLGSSYLPKLAINPAHFLYVDQVNQPFIFSIVNFNLPLKSNWFLLQLMKRRSKKQLRAHLIYYCLLMLLKKHLSFFVIVSYTCFKLSFIYHYPSIQQPSITFRFSLRYFAHI